MKKTLFVALVIMLGAGPTAMAQKQVSVDFDKTYDYSKIKTFALQLQTAWGNPLGEKRVLAEVEEVLVEKGWAKTDAATADAMVIVNGTTETKTRLNAMYSGGGWRFGGLRTGTVQEVEYKVGTLLVDIFDAKSKDLLYRGVATGELSADVDKNQKKLDKATTKMFKDFPPAPKQEK